MSAIVHFEIYVEDARGWSLQARYPSADRDICIREAHMLEESLKRAVKVVRETYYPELNQNDDSVVWTSRIRPRPRQTMMPPRGSGDYAAGSGPGANQSTAEAPKRPASAADLMVRITLIIIASLLLSVMGAGLVSALLSNIPSSVMHVSTGEQRLILFVVFLGLFLIIAVPLILLYVPLDFLMGGNRAAAKAQAKARDQEKQAREKERAREKADREKAEKEKEKAERDKAEKEAVTKETEKPKPAPALTAEQVKSEMESKRKEQLKEQWRKEKEEEDRDVLETALKQDTQANKDQQKQEEDKKKREEDEARRREASLHLEQARLVIMKFLGGAVNIIKTTHPQLDTYNRFGVNLYLAGACEMLATHRKLTPEDSRRILLESVEVIGTKAEQARHLLDRMTAYQREPRYTQMISAGRAAMDAHISGKADPFLPLGAIMKEWNTPQSRQLATSNTVTILFTDMVGSTDMTQLMGDVAAQDVVRAHNTIVRRALAEHHGKEVKHTGDGIMASFEDPLNAVKAAVDIQIKSQEHTARWPRLPLHLRIGMNTGEPIIEENDYFGSTVQIAARVCAAADDAQVFISQETYNVIPPASGVRFYNHGPRPLKGVKEPQVLFEAVWNDARGAELEALAALQKEAGASETTAPDETTENVQVTDAGAEQGNDPQMNPDVSPAGDSTPSALTEPSRPAPETVPSGNGQAPEAQTADR